MLSIPIVKFPYFEGQKITDKASDMIHNFFDSEYSTFVLFYNFNRAISDILISDVRFNNNKRLLEYVTYAMLEYLGKNINDGYSSSIEEDYGQVYKTAYDYVKSFNLTRMNSQTKFLRKRIEELKKEFVVYKGYSWNDAFSVLEGSGTLKDRILTFSKILLISNDYFNVDMLYKLRNIILKSPYLDEKDRNLFAAQKPEKDILKLFLADYKVLCVLVVFNKDIRKYLFEEDNPEPLSTYILLFNYGRFILNIYILLFQCKAIAAVKNINIEDEMRIENNKLKMEIIFAKIYTRLEYKLYSLCSEYMTECENMKYIISKLCDEVCIHEQANIGYDKLNRYSSFKIAINKIIGNNDNYDIIEEMKNLIICDLDKGIKYSHIQMIEYLKKNKKYANAISKWGVETKLKKLLIDVCKNTKDLNGNRRYPYIQGTDVWGKIEKVATTSNSSQKKSEIDSKKNAKKMA